MDFTAASTLALNLLIGGVLSLFIKFLYHRYSMSLSNRDTLSDVFPLLTLTIIIVIYVVKSSLALSLGLVGALSIVRFRTPIKDPEELVYLFLCIAIGLALGADHKIMAFIAMVFITSFIIIRHRFSKRGKKFDVLVTVSGDSKHFHQSLDNNVSNLLTDIFSNYTIQRFDSDSSQAQLRAVISPKDSHQIHTMIERFNRDLPTCQISYVNLESLI